MFRTNWVSDQLVLLIIQLDYFTVAHSERFELTSEVSLSGLCVAILNGCCMRFVRILMTMSCTKTRIAWWLDWLRAGQTGAFCACWTRLLLKFRFVSTALRYARVAHNSITVIDLLITFHFQSHLVKFDIKWPEIISREKLCSSTRTIFLHQNSQANSYKFTQALVRHPAAQDITRSHAAFQPKIILCVFFCPHNWL